METNKVGDGESVIRVIVFGTSRIKENGTDAPYTTTINLMNINECNCLIFGLSFLNDRGMACEQGQVGGEGSLGDEVGLWAYDSHHIDQLNLCSRCD